MTTTTSIWKLAATSLPPEHYTVLIRTVEGYIFTSRLSTHKNHQTWKMKDGAWPVHKVVAWCEVPPLDIEIPKAPCPTCKPKRPPAPPVVAERG